MEKFIFAIKWLSLTVKRGFIFFGELMAGSEGNEPKRKVLRYFIYFIILLAVNFLVGKNIGSTRFSLYSNIAIFLLVNINIILLLVLMLVIFRNLAKLLSEAHSNIFGSRLKFKLVIFSVALTIMPVSVIFLFAGTLINDSINKWFNEQIDSALSSSMYLMDDYRGMVKQGLLDYTLLISRIITDRNLYAEQKDLKTFINGYAGKNFLTGISVYDKSGSRVIFKDDTHINYIPNISAKYLNSVLKGNKETGYDYLNKMHVYWAGIPIERSGKVYGAVFSYKAISGKIANDIDLIQDARDKYRESKFFSYPIKKSYLMLLATMSLLVIFSGIWGSILFAKSITKPVEDLADASVDISRGNFNVEVKEQGGDEISYLIRTFNRMVKQLSMHTNELHAKNTILSEMYNQIARDSIYIDTIFKNVDSALILINRDMKPLKTNARADALIFNSKDEIDGSVMHDLESFALSDDTDFYRDIEFTINKERRMLSVKFSKILSDDGEFQILLVITDITDVINVQRINIWKETAARIAHEVKNPLTPIKLMAERVKKRSSELRETDVKKIIQGSMDTIVAETDNLLELIEEFNFFARLPKPKKSPVELSELVNEVFSLYSQTHPYIKFDYSGECGLIIQGDRGQLRRMLQNLVGNAVFAISRSGEIIISAVYSAGENIEIKIVDTGSGIKDEDISKIFDPYFSKRSGGTGLGLAIVKKIVEEHSGGIKVESSPNGTTFTITLPRGA